MTHTDAQGWLKTAGYTIADSHPADGVDYAHPSLPRVTVFVPGLAPKAGPLTARGVGNVAVWRKDGAWFVPLRALRQVLAWGVGL